MAKSKGKTRDNEWLGYYKKFNYFSPQKVREGCHPRIMEHPQKPEKAIVLAHGLSDSPYFMNAIGEYFFKELGYNVYIPLLHFHGLKEPMGMEGVELEEWKANVSFAVKTAASKAKEVSIGGLSTGGALSFYMITTNPKVNGDLYLFSAALDLAGGPFGLLGELREKVGRTFLIDLFDFNKPLLGLNPYRYSHVDHDGARELVRLIKETDNIMDGLSRKNPFPKRVIEAHSEKDTTADIAGIQKLQKLSIEDQFEFFRIPKKEDVPHASVVLKEKISAGDKSEKANPMFSEMMRKIKAFQK